MHLSNEQVLSGTFISSKLNAWMPAQYDLNSDILHPIFIKENFSGNGLKSNAAKEMIHLYDRKTLIDIENDLEVDLFASRPFVYLDNVESFNNRRQIVGSGYILDFGQNDVTGLPPSSRREPDGSRPLTPPYVRDRIRRFMITMT